MKPDTEGYWLVRREIGKRDNPLLARENINDFFINVNSSMKEEPYLLVKVTEDELGKKYVAATGFFPKEIGTFEREFEIIEWIKEIKLEDL